MLRLAVLARFAAGLQCDCKDGKEADTCAGIISEFNRPVTSTPAETDAYVCFCYDTLAGESQQPTALSGSSEYAYPLLDPLLGGIAATLKVVHGAADAAQAVARAGEPILQSQSTPKSGSSKPGSSIKQPVDLKGQMAPQSLWGRISSLLGSTEIPIKANPDKSVAAKAKPVSSPALLAKLAKQCPNPEANMLDYFGPQALLHALFASSHFLAAIESAGSSGVATALKTLVDSFIRRPTGNLNGFVSSAGVAPLLGQFQGKTDPIALLQHLRENVPELNSLLSDVSATSPKTQLIYLTPSQRQSCSEGFVFPSEDAQSLRLYELISTVEKDRDFFSSHLRIYLKHPRWFEANRRYACVPLDDSPVWGGSTILAFYRRSFDFEYPLLFSEIENQRERRVLQALASVPGDIIDQEKLRSFKTGSSVEIDQVKFLDGLIGKVSKSYQVMDSSILLTKNMGFESKPLFVQSSAFGFRMTLTVTQYTTVVTHPVPTAKRIPPNQAKAASKQVVDRQITYQLMAVSTKLETFRLVKAPGEVYLWVRIGQGGLINFARFEDIPQDEVILFYVDIKVLDAHNTDPMDEHRLSTLRGRSFLKVVDPVRGHRSGKAMRHPSASVGQRAI